MPKAVVASPAALVSFIGSANLACCRVIIKISTTIEELGGNFTIVAMFTHLLHIFTSVCYMNAIDVLNSRFSFFSVNLKYRLPYCTLDCLMPLSGTGSFESLRKIHRQFKDIHVELDKIKSRYRGQFIAICDGEFIGDTDHQILLEKIREKVEEKDIDSIFETYISKTDDILMM